MGGFHSDEPKEEVLVHKSKLIETLKDDFKMTIDIERLIMEIDTDEKGLIEYDEFKSLLAD